jgi:hypothetical protein
MMAPGTVDTHLEPPGHIAFHSLPVTAASEPFRWRGGHLHQDRAHGRPYLNRAGIEEVAAWHCLVQVIVLMSAEKRNVVRII